MKFTAIAFSLMAVCAPANAQTRPFTPALTCAAVKAVVAQRMHVVLASSPNAYELVHVDGGSCIQGYTAAPAFEPTSDDPYCFAGYRCRQRDNETSGSR